jgi:hypothetical protein
MLARAIVVGLGAAVFLGSPLLRGPAYAAEPRDGRIGRDEVISRAEDWVFRDVPYSQTAKATDPEGISYRTDCTSRSSGSPACAMLRSRHRPASCTTPSPTR